MTFVPNKSDERVGWAGIYIYTDTLYRSNRHICTSNESIRLRVVKY